MYLLIILILNSLCEVTLLDFLLSFGETFNLLAFTTFTTFTTFFVPNVIEIFCFFPSILLLKFVELKFSY